jgi:uncharacterized protein with FMN-binding domain
VKKVILVIVVVLLIGGFVVFYNKQSSLSEDPDFSPSPESSQNAKYKDGTYTGKIGSASQYGDIQVQAVISGGKITDIIFLKFPSGGGHTAEVTAMAEPILKQEAITTQSAKVNIVSGATQDTEGFTQSLQSALDQAKI